MDNYSPPKPRAPRMPRTPGSAMATPSCKRASTDAASGSPARKTPVKRIKKEAKKDPKLVIGIDFGTTYTGVGFSWSEKDDGISVVMSWNDSNQDFEKVPSAINFDVTANGDNTTWGYGAKGLAGAIEWFKLLLVDKEDLPTEVGKSKQVQAARKRLRELNKTVSDVVSDYLRRLWSHSIRMIKIEIGEATVDHSRFHIVITLPAIWPQYARDRMRLAAIEAGMLRMRDSGETTLTFISEPEAAALATLSGVDGRCDIHEGDSFVVVDCGGGTVDIISYKVTSTEPMVVREVVQGQGSLCGAVFVDDRFLDLLKNKFKGIFEGAWDSLDPEELKDIMSQNWENGIRNQFSGETRTWTVRVPHSILDGVPRDQRGKYPKLIEISSKELEDVFHPIVEKIKSLVDAQVDAVKSKEGCPPKYTILVGGFGKCRYLYEYLHQQAHGVEVLQSRGSGPWTAICRGAVIHGLMLEKLGARLAVEVRSRISRASYGITCQEDFDEEKHLEEDKVWDAEQNCWKAARSMKWLVKEGEDIMSQKKPFRKNFFRILADQPECLHTTFWMTKAQPPPSRRDDSVTKLCEVKWDTWIDMTKLPLFINNEGISFPRLDFTAEMKFTSGSIEFFIIHKGKRQASKNVTVEFYDNGDI